MLLKQLKLQVADVGAGSLCAKRSEGTVKTRRYIVAEGFGPDHRLGVYNNNVDTIERAFVERYFLCKEGEGFRPALRPEPHTFGTDSMVEFRARTMAHMPRLPVLDECDVVAMYHGAKQRLYERARVSLLRNGLLDSDAALTSFVKFEKQDVRKAPRVINPRHPRYNLSLGKYLKHAEKHFYRAINETFGGHTRATVIKGFNASDSAAILRAKWDRFSRPVAIGLDATKFDMHVSQAALIYEHSFYRSLFPDCDELVRLLRCQLVNSGRAYAADGRVKFTMQGTRSSGDLNTSLGNCVLMCAMIYSFSAERGVTVELANNGDDCVVFLEETDLARFQEGLDEWFRAKGFAMAVEQPARVFEEVEFCQTHPILVSGAWRMIRNHHAVLTKDPMCLMPIDNDRAYQKWLYAVGECGQNAVGNCPVQSAFYSALRRNGVECSKGFKEAVFRNTGWGTRSRGLGHGEAEGTVDDAARASYYLAYGVTPDAQIAIEQYYGTATFARLPDVVMNRDDFCIQSGLSLLLHPSNDP